MYITCICIRASFSVGRLQHVRAVQGRPASSRLGFVYIESLQRSRVCCRFVCFSVCMEGLMLVCFCGEGLAWSCVV